MLLSMNTENLALRPNCLLTRYPLIFITGLRSLFHHRPLGTDLQDFLTAHGYRVLCPAMPFRNSDMRKSYLLRWLRTQPEQRFHFVAGEQTANELQEVIATFPGSTVTKLPGQFQSLIEAGQTRTPLSFHLHRAYCKLSLSLPPRYSETLPLISQEFLQRFLDHCIELAENDHI